MIVLTSACLTVHNIDCKSTQPFKNVPVSKKKQSLGRGAKPHHNAPAYTRLILTLLSSNTDNLPARDQHSCTLPLEHCSPWQPARFSTTAGGAPRGPLPASPLALWRPGPTFQWPWYKQQGEGFTSTFSKPRSEHGLPPPASKDAGTPPRARSSTCQH